MYIMGVQLRATLKILDTIVPLYSKGFRPALNWAPVMPRTTPGHSTNRNLFGILLNQPEIRLYLPFSN